MRELNDLRRIVAKKKTRYKLFSREMKAHLRIQFAKQNVGTYDQDIIQQTTLAQLAYEPLSNRAKYDQALHDTGYQLDPSLA